LHIDSIQKKCI